MGITARQWIDRYSLALGVAAPTDDEVEAILDLAGAAAHASERTAAPVSAWLAARADVPVDAAFAAARHLAAEIDNPGG
jgi:Domain of unknown function (DUF6457)